MTHEEICHQLFNHACRALKVGGLKLNTIGQLDSLRKSKNRYVMGSINLKNKIIKLKIFTPKTGKPKSYGSLLRIIAHELAHYQRPPFRQFFKGHWINRQHYPEFYWQVNDNIAKLRRDKVLGRFFTRSNW